MGNVRRCLGCLESDISENLLRCVALDNTVVVDEAKKHPGRGAWVHPTAECVSQSLKRRAWSRALKQGPRLDCLAVEELVGQLTSDRTG